MRDGFSNLSANCPAARSSRPVGGARFRGAPARRRDLTVTKKLPSQPCQFVGTPLGHRHAVASRESSAVRVASVGGINIHEPQKPWALSGLSHSALRRLWQMCRAIKVRFANPREDIALELICPIRLQILAHMLIRLHSSACRGVVTWHAANLRTTLVRRSAANWASADFRLVSLFLHALALVRSPALWATKVAVIPRSAVFAKNWSTASGPIADATSRRSGQIDLDRAGDPSSRFVFSNRMGGFHYAASLSGISKGRVGVLRTLQAPATFRGFGFPTITCRNLVGYLVRNERASTVGPGVIHLPTSALRWSLANNLRTFGAEYRPKSGVKTQGKARRDNKIRLVEQSAGPRFKSGPRLQTTENKE
jgi:hypothetical protein